MNFLNYVNEAHDTIKFTWNWSNEQVNYLHVDVQVINNNGKLETDLYIFSQQIKSSIFSYTSCHPRMCKNGIPFAKALRLRRICSTSYAFECRATDLCAFLVARRYSKAFVLRKVPTIVIAHTFCAS